MAHEVGDNALIVTNAGARSALGDLISHRGREVRYPDLRGATHLLHVETVDIIDQRVAVAEQLDDPSASSTPT